MWTQRICHWACALCLTLSFSALAQEQEIEQLLETNSAYADPSDLLELLDEFEKHPIDINKATEAQLAVFPLLTPLQAKAIVQHRQKIGAYRSLADLAQIDLIDPALLPILKRYVTVDPNSSREPFSISSRSRFSKKIGTSQTTKDSVIAGSPTKTYHRMDVRYGDQLRAGILLEKDSGERRLDDLRIYFLSYFNRATGNRLILGNYRLEFAQGLIFGNPYGYYKGSAAHYSVTRRSRELFEYTAVDENASLYGVSAKLCFKIYQLFLFLSHNKLDATVNDEGKIKNFYHTGLHRTPGELAKKDQLVERLHGGRLVIKPAEFLSLGATYYRSAYDPDIAIQDKDLNRFALHGRSNWLIGMDYQLTRKAVHCFGEFARSQNHGLALLHGLVFQSKSLQLIISYRHYSEKFISPHGNGFGERGNPPQNEQGFYWGILLRANSQLHLSFYFDQYRFPWRSYSIAMPSNGKDALFQLDYQPTKNVRLTTQYRFEQKEHQISENRQIIPRIEYRLRTQLEVQPDDHFTLRARMEKKWVSYRYYSSMPYAHAQKFNGIVLYQDMILQLNQNFDLALRLGWFDTDSYESRLYQFEHDVRGVLTNQMLYGVGTRYYLRLHWQPYRFLELSLKWGSTQYSYLPATGLKFAGVSSTLENSLNFQIEMQW